MNKTTIVLTILLALILALAGCGSESSETAESSNGIRLNDDYADALPVSAQLAR